MRAALLRREASTSAAVFRLQVSAIGRTAGPWILGVVALLCLSLAMGAMEDAIVLNFLAPIGAAIAPFALWAGRRLFDGGDLCTLPIERSRHALLIIAAGAVWVGFTSALAVLALCGVFLFTGRPLAVWTLMVPVGGGLTAYAFASAVAVGLRFPLRWATAFLGVLVVGLLLIVRSGAPDPLLAVVYGDFGLDQVLTGGLGSGRPDPGRWLAALAVWLGGGLLAVIAASNRHREH